MHNPVKKKLARTFFLYFLFDSPHVFLFFVLGKGKEVGAFWVGFALSEGEKRGKKSEQKRALDFFPTSCFFLYFGCYFYRRVFTGERGCGFQVTVIGWGCSSLGFASKASKQARNYLD